MEICIIGTGWYGCYICEKLLEKNSSIKITLIDKCSSIFTGASYNNQNRLHLGFHYPRCEITRKKCKSNFKKFINRYNNITEFINNNIYAISKNSKINIKDYLNLYEDYEILSNKYLTNTEDKLISVKERYINFFKAKEYFELKFKDKINYIFNYKVYSISNFEDKVVINNEMSFNKVFNCTYNQIKSTENVTYEKCLTLLYRKINTTFFDTLTIMDGDYFSIFKYHNDIYSLTHVKYTPVAKGCFEDVEKCTNINIEKYKKNMESDVLKFYPNFLKNFKYTDYYTSYKCKNISVNDSRDINISIDRNICNVWCGKISLIFDIDDIMDAFLEI